VRRSLSPVGFEARRFVRYALPVLLYLALIFTLSAQPSLAPPSPLSFDKVAHFGEYAVLCWLVARALFGYGIPARPVAVLAVLLCSLYGASDEVHQRYVPNRTPSVADWVADTLGATAAAGFWYARRRLKGDRLL
jgi:VanZ family protein